MYMCVHNKCECVRHILFNTSIQFLEEFNEMWRKLLDWIIWEFQYQIEFVLDDEVKEPLPQRKMVCITFAV